MTRVPEGEEMLIMLLPAKWANGPVPRNSDVSANCPGSDSAPRPWVTLERKNQRRRSAVPDSSRSGHGWQKQGGSGSRD